MGVFKPLEVNNSGIIATYWNVIQLNINYLTRTAHVQTAGYLTEQARRDGKMPIDFRTYDFDQDNFPFTGQEPISERQEFYTWLMTHREARVVENTNPETKNNQPTVTVYEDSEFYDAVVA